MNLTSAEILTLKAPSKICSRQQSKLLFFLFYFSEKTSLDISGESSAKQTIHMKCQDRFSLKNNKKKMSSTVDMIGAFRVNVKCLCEPFEFRRCISNLSFVTSQSLENGCIHDRYFEFIQIPAILLFPGKFCLNLHQNKGLVKFFPASHTYC